MSLTSTYKLKIENSILEIKHSIIQEYTFFDICDFDGKIYLTGNLTEQEMVTNADLSEIPKGNYELFIISGGTVYSEKIKL